jgi:predicted O-methyltransferase YrrM
MINIIPTLDSLDKVRSISIGMEGQPFHFHSHLLYDIRTALGPNKINYLEIGTAYGMSVALVAAHPYPTNCYGIDLGVPEGIEQNVNNNVDKFKNTESAFKYYKGNSRSNDVLNSLQNDVNQFDFIFIDGDHSTFGATRDFEIYSTMLKSGGILVFDDYLDEWDSPGVRIAIDQIVVDYANEYDIIGSLTYDMIDDFSDKIKSSNLFIMVKK